LFVKYENFRSHFVRVWWTGGLMLLCMFVLIIVDVWVRG